MQISDSRYWLNIHEKIIFCKSKNIPTGSLARGLKSAKSPLASAEAKSAKSALFSAGECFIWLLCKRTWYNGHSKSMHLTQLTERYIHHILSLFDIVSTNAFGPAYLQSLDSAVKELLSLVFQPKNWLVLGKFASFHEFQLFHNHNMRNNLVPDGSNWWHNVNDIIHNVHRCQATNMACNLQFFKHMESELWRNAGPSVFQYRL